MNIKSILKAVAKAILLVIVGELFMDIGLSLFGYVLVVTGHYQIGKLVVTFVLPSNINGESVKNSLAAILCKIKAFFKDVQVRADQKMPR